MKVSIAMLLFLAVVGLLANVHIPPAHGEQKAGDVRKLAEGNNAFALDLYARLRARGGNLFFSPYSISTALAMTYAGARGATEKQMAEVLHFTLGQERLHPAFARLQRELNEAGKRGAFELNVANAIWAQKGYTFLKDYLSLLEKDYGAGPNEVDFVRAVDAARKRINAWVEEKTRGKIKDLIKPGALNALTRLVLTNAIYFKGKWASRFKEKHTKKAPFTLPDGKEVKVPMMNQKDRFRYAEKENMQVLELPYIGDELSMFIMLPKKVDGLAGVEKSLTTDNLSKWINELVKREIIVYLPRFKTTSEFGLADMLSSMGMKDAFSLPPADFSGMTGKRDLFISAVIHKAFVDVNEEGTEAAAATGVVMRMAAMPSPPPVFRADHPFLFLIRDNRSGSILFLGRLMNPTV